MSTFPGSPKLLKGGLVLLDPDTSKVLNILVLQYNPDSLKRSFQIKAVNASEGDRSEALRLSGPPVETLKLDAEIDATDQLEFPDRNPNTTEFGVQPQLAAMEALIYPSSSQLVSNNELAAGGTLEIIPMQTPLVLFVWTKSRIMPVRVTELSITEEAFDPILNPIRAKVSLGMRVLTVDDVGFAHKAGSLFMSYLQNKEQLATKFPSGTFGELGIRGIS